MVRYYCIAKCKKFSACGWSRVCGCVSGIQAIGGDNPSYEVISRKGANIGQVQIAEKREELLCVRELLLDERKALGGRCVWQCRFV